MTAGKAVVPGHITALYIFAIISWLSLFHVSIVDANITVTDPNNRTVAVFDDLPASFGPRFPRDGLTGYTVYASPATACDKVAPPPYNLTKELKWILVIKRNECAFDTKVANAQRAGYDAVIVHNIDSQELITMGRKDHQEIFIPSCFVGESDGILLGKQFNYQKRRRVTIDDSAPVNPNYYLLPFAVVVGVCFILMVIFMVAKWLRDIRKKRRSRLSKSHLKKIPIKKFKKGDDFDVCAICLDDYEEGEKLRLLPCAHAYHVKCVDPWLLNNKRTCPVCKRKVIPGDDHDSDSSSGEEDVGRVDASEVTPLLRSQQPPARASTFDNSGLPDSLREHLATVHLDTDSEDSEYGPDADMRYYSESPVSEAAENGEVASSSQPGISGMFNNDAGADLTNTEQRGASPDPPLVHVLVNTSINADCEDAERLGNRTV